MAAMVAALLAPAATIAGTTGELVGTVTDDQNAPIAGATVAVESPAQREQTVSDGSGHFVFVSLAPGTYTITFSSKGFLTNASQVAVAADSSSTLAARMQRRAWIVRMIDRTAAGLIRPETTSDVYAVPSYWPFYDINGTDIYALRFLPGLTFGSGPVVSQ